MSDWTAEAPPRRSWASGGAAALASHILVFGVLAVPWLRAAPGAIPGGDYLPDSILIEQIGGASFSGPDGGAMRLPVVVR